jgi:glc operon protein GlcG
MKRTGLAVIGLGVLAGAAGPAQSGAGRAVTYLAADRVAAAFAKGEPLLEVENYKVHASRRDAPGQAEVHVADTDIIHVLTGSATFVAGGRVVGGRDVAPEEIRGASVEGGEALTIRAGDVIVVPDGTPHWFKSVPAPMTYYVVKVRTGGGAR